jgi:hypothetical protein
MARVNIDDVAFSDLRFDVLAKRAGLTDADHARGKMARLWKYCTDSETYYAPGEVIVAVLGDGGVDAMIASGLGRIEPDGIYVCGSRGRTEWLGAMRSRNTKGGQSRAKAQRDKHGRLTGKQDLSQPVTSQSPAKAGGDSPACTSPLTLTLAPTLTLTHKDLSMRRGENHDAITQVIEHYQAKHPQRGRHLKPGHADWKRIEARIKEGFTVEQLKQAIDGNLRDAWHSENKKHSVEFVFRNATKVEDFIATSSAKQASSDGRPTPEEIEAKNIRVRESQEYGDKINEIIRGMKGAVHGH